MSVKWAYRLLGDVCTTSAGGTPLKLKSEYYEGGDIPWLMSGEVDRRDITEATRFITSDGMANSSAKLFPSSSVLVAMYGATAGQVGILRFQAATNQAVCAILPNGYFSPEFLYYFLLSKNGPIVASATGNAQPNISQAKIRALQVPMIPKQEQGRIVAILDEAFEGITTTETNVERILKSTSALLEQTLDETFSSRNPCWSRARLGDICSIASKLIDPREDKYQDLIHIGAGNIESRSGRLCNLQKASQEGLISGKFLFKVGSVLYSKIRPYLRKIVRPDFGGICSADIYPLLPNKEVLTRDFLYYLLLSANFTQYAIAGSARTGMPKVNRDHLFEYEVLVPPVSSQKQITSKLQSIEIASRALEDVQQRKITVLSELKKSLLHQAFSGNL